MVIYIFLFHCRHCENIWVERYRDATIGTVNCMKNTKKAQSGSSVQTLCTVPIQILEIQVVDPIKID
jgi:hypothetical protein